MTRTPDRSAPADPAADDTVLEARSLTRHFPVRRTAADLRAGRRRVVHAVDGVSLRLRRGTVTALVGESGCGKSTVARLLARVQPATAGEVLFDGEPVPAGRRAFRRHVRRVQLVLQDPFASLNPVHRVRYTLTRALRVHRGRLSGPQLEAALADLLERVSLTPAQDYLDRFPHELSGGQRQRVSIARALAAEPAVLLADEPVSMLDVSIRLGVLNLLRDLTDRLRLAVLYITHDIASARYFADTTLVMYAGQAVEGGPSEEVTASPAHPYTQLLVESAPDPDRIERLRGAGDGGTSADLGEPPDLLDPPAGCRFHPRCPVALARCRDEVPPRVDVGAGHWAACWAVGVPGHDPLDPAVDSAQGVPA